MNQVEGIQEIKTKTMDYHSGLHLHEKNQRGEVGYKYKSDVYRTTIRVNSKTPTTFQELSTNEIERARRENAKAGRVDKSKQ